MSRKLTVFATDIRLVDSNLDIAVGGVPAELERCAKLVNEAYSRNGDREALANLLSFTSNEPARDMKTINTIDTSGNRQTGPGVGVPVTVPSIPPPAPSNEQTILGTQPTVPPPAPTNIPSPPPIASGPIPPPPPSFTSPSIAPPPGA